MTAPHDTQRRGESFYEWRCGACGHDMEHPPPTGRLLDPCLNCGASQWVPVSPLKHLLATHHTQEARADG